MIHIGLFATGWLAGWFMLWNARHLVGRRVGAQRTADAGPLRPDVSIVIPARNEAHILGRLIESLVAQCHDGDEIIVVDDHSTDGTAAVALMAAATAGTARADGANVVRVISAPELPVGWAGKPHACHVGARAARRDILTFVDADVTLGPGALDALVGEVMDHPDALTSVQPWHRAGRGAEQLSMLFNIAALMGCTAFTLAGRRPHPKVAFGPVLGCDRARYEAIGGHADPQVRNSILEDIALARRFGRSNLFVGRRNEVTFRMYPTGFRAVCEGWTKSIGIGVDATPWWATLGTAAWVTSLAGGWVTSPWFALASLVQVAVLARRAGEFSGWAIVTYPVGVAFFAAIVGRSLLRRRRKRGVSWKGRVLVPDQRVG